MVTFVESEYIYKPTPPRSKITATGRKSGLEPVSTLNKLQQIRSSRASLTTLWPAAPAVAAADGDGGCRPKIRGTGTVYGDIDKENHDEINDDSRDLPTVEKLLLAKLQEQGFAAPDPNPGHKERGVEESAVDERGGAIDHHGSALGDNSGGSLEDPILLQGDGDSGASEAEISDNALRAESAAAPGAGPFDSPETAIDSTSTSNSTHPQTPSSRPSSEPLHDSTEGSRHARSEATTSSSRPPPRHCRASPETQLSHESRLHTGRGVADEHEQVDPALDILLIDKGEREQQEVEQEKDEGHGEDEDEGPQQEVNVVAPAVTAERAGGSPGPANGRQSPPNLDPSPEPNHDEAESRSDRDSDDELNNTESDEDDEEPRPAKRKRSSSSRDGPMRKKPKHCLQQRSTGQRRPRSKPHRQYPKSHSPLDQCSSVATSSRAKGRLPSPAPSTPQSIDTKLPLDESSLGRSSRATSPTLTEITFRLHSADCCSFTAVIYAEQGVSFGQLSRLIASIGHAGKIDDFTIKPMEQHSFLVTGFSRYASSRLSSGGKAVSTTAEAGRDHIDATRPRPHHGKTMHAQPLASQEGEPSSSDDDGSLSDSDPDLSSDDDGCSSEAEKQGGLSTGVNIPWDPVDEQRLLAWKKEGKSWDWIFAKFPGRTENAVRTRLSMVKHRVKRRVK